MTQAYRDLQAKIMNPTHLEAYPDEACAGTCGLDLTEPAYSVDEIGFCCSGCTRGALVNDYQNRLPDELDKPPLIVVAVDRCDGCGYFICMCPCEFCGSVKCRCP